MEIKTINLDKVDPMIPSGMNYEVEPTEVNKKSMFSKNNIITLVTFLIVASAGFYTGALLKTSGSVGSVGSNDVQSSIPDSGVKAGDVYGSKDEKAFRDSATGVIDKGGLSGEGTHKLVRPGGATQTVYLTSSVIDLDTLVGHQVTVWGETFKSQKVSWLMDVGRVKVENLNMPLPK